MWDPSLFIHKPGMKTEGVINAPVTRAEVLQSYIKRVRRHVKCAQLGVSSPKGLLSKGLGDENCIT